MHGHVFLMCLSHGQVFVMIKRISHAVKLTLEMLFKIFIANNNSILFKLVSKSFQNCSLARLHEVHRAIVVTSVVPVYVYVYVYVRVTLSVKVFYKSISLDHVDGSS